MNKKIYINNFFIQITYSRINQENQGFTLSHMHTLTEDQILPQPQLCYFMLRLNVVEVLVGSLNFDYLDMKNENCVFCNTFYLK